MFDHVPVLASKLSVILLYITLRKRDTFQEDSCFLANEIMVEPVTCHCMVICDVQFSTVKPRFNDPPRDRHKGVVK
jgi:hypothetical protein